MKGYIIKNLIRVTERKRLFYNLPIEVDKLGQ